MQRSFLVLGAVLACGCGGADFTIPEGGTDAGDGGSGDGGGGMDVAMDVCNAQPEICGDGLDNDCDGTVDNGCKGIGTYVSGATGLDTDPGTKLKPVKTIAQGIKNAQAIGGKLTVYVANSHYSEKVMLVEGISLDGGYHCDAMLCDWARNPGTYDSAILNTDFEGVLAPGSITRATRIDGFRVQGMGGQPNTVPGSACITVLGSPTISQNRLNGADITGGTAWNTQRTSAVAILAPISDPNGPLIDNNDIQGGAGMGGWQSYGVLYDWIANAPPNSFSAGLVRNNRIRGGNATTTAGVSAWSSAGTAAVIGNSITTGTGSGGNNGTFSFGVAIGGTLLVDGNLINTDQSTVGTCNGVQWCGGLASQSSTSIVTNNVIYGSKAPNSAAVFLTEAEKTAGVVILNGNFLDGAGVLLTNVTKSAGVVLRINSGNAALAVGRIRNNIIQGGMALQRFGIHEDQIQNKTNKPAAMEFNNFFFPALPNRTDIYWRQWSGTAITDITGVPANNQGGDPLVDNTWHLMGGSPCIDKATATEAPAKDRDGQNRPMGGGYDIGADEK